MLKKITILLTLLLVFSMFVPIQADKPGRVRILESEIESLKARVNELEMVTGNLESNLNFVLSGDFAKMVCQSCY